MSYSLFVPLRVCLCVRGNQCTARMCMLVHHPAVDSGSSCRLIYVPQVSIPWTMAWLQCITAATAMTPLWPHKVAPPPPPLHDGSSQNHMMPIFLRLIDLTMAIISAYHLFSPSLLPVNRASLWCNASQLQRAQRTTATIDVFPRIVAERVFLMVAALVYMLDRKVLKKKKNDGGSRCCCLVVL